MLSFLFQIYHKPLEDAHSSSGDENFENSTKCWICDNNLIDGDVKVRNHFHITKKYRASPDRDCNINIK